MRYLNRKNTGFSLIELLIGLVIGLLATLVIMQVFSMFEGQRRSTSGTSDAQTSGSIALYSVQRDVQLAGYGLPLYDKDNLSVKCITPPTYNHDSNAATPEMSMWPVDIIDGGTTAGASDTVIVRYGNSPSGGIPIVVIGAPPGNLDVKVASNMACNDGDSVFAVTGSSACAVTTINDPTLVTNLTARTNNDTITLMDRTGISASTRLSCMGRWTEVVYNVTGDNLMRSGTPFVAGIVNMQAQYGISAVPNSNEIRQWVDATGAWIAPGNSAINCDSANANRNCIKALRVAFVARNGLLEKEAISKTCSSVTSANPTGVCSWDATSASPAEASAAPAIDLTNLSDWDHYRYRVYESVITLRNAVWSKSRL